MNNYSPLVLATPVGDERKKNQYSWVDNPTIRMSVRADQILFYDVQCKSLCYQFDNQSLSTVCWIALLLLCKPTLSNLICTQQTLYWRCKPIHECWRFRSELVNYACVWALNKPLKKLEMSMQPTFITLTGIPQQLSVTVSVTTNSGAQ